jgi:hypothetical protein
LALSAVAKDFNQNFLRPEMVFSADRLFPFPYRGILELYDLSAFQAYQVIMVWLIMDMFIVMVVLPVDYLFDEPGLYQNRQRSIDRCLGNAAPFLSKTVGEFVSLKVTFRGENFLQDTFPLRGSFKPLLL